MELIYKKTSLKNKSMKERLAYYSIPEPNTGCWLWVGSSRGKHFESGIEYGCINVNNKTFLTHRISYETFVGTIPKGKVVRHKCDTTLCINPEHLILGTQYENMQDCKQKGRNSGYVRHKICKRGHEMTGYNLKTKFYKGLEKRSCRKCQNIMRRIRLKERSS